jgi:hypothetical protein
MYMISFVLFRLDPALSPKGTPRLNRPTRGLSRRDR